MDLLKQHVPESRVISCPRSLRIYNKDTYAEVGGAPRGKAWKWQLLECRKLGWDIQDEDEESLS